LPGRQSSLLWKAGETVALIRHTINLKITSALPIKTVWSNAAMSSIIKFLNRLRSDENGASLIEYTVLLAILITAVIAVIAGVGKWISTQWASLSTAI
jgi:pilus assembly protein Flp/PilA